MKTKCPNCGPCEVYEVKRDANFPVSVAYVVLGLAFAVFFLESRKRVLRCAKCGETLKRHSWLSPFFLILYWLILAGLVVTVLSVLLGI